VRIENKETADTSVSWPANLGKCFSQRDGLTIVSAIKWYI